MPPAEFTVTVELPGRIRTGLAFAAIFASPCFHKLARRILKPRIVHN